MRHTTGILGMCGLALFGLLAVGGRAQDKAALTQAAVAFRVEANGFDGASEADIRAVLSSAGRELFQYFPGYKIEPIVVTRGHKGPITLFARNRGGEIVVQLDTAGLFWCQYAYQYAHELCHVLCGYKAGYEGNRWFEETLCETASLFAMRSMSKTWKQSPPYSNWRDYRDALRDYCDDVIRGRTQVHEIYARGLSGFYQAHKDQLQKESCVRELNGAMAVVLLGLFEEQPRRWEAVRWLNSTPSRPGDSFATYLQNWHDAVPAGHREFVKLLAELYGMPLKSASPPAGK